MTRKALAEHLQNGEEVILETGVARTMFPGTDKESSQQIQAFCDERFTAYRHDEKTGKHHLVPRGF